MVIHGASPDSTVAGGSIQARWAWADSGRQTAKVRAVHLIIEFISIVPCSRFDGNGKGAQLAAALGAGGAWLRRWPAEGHAQQFATADFAGGFHHQVVVAGDQILERRFAAFVAQLMGADRAGRGADAVHRHLQAATAATPPLSHVLQPLLAFVVLELQVVPDSQFGYVVLVRLF